MPTFVFSVPGRSLGAMRVDRDQPLSIRIIKMRRDDGGAIAQPADRVQEPARTLQEIARFGPHSTSTGADARGERRAGSPTLVQCTLPNQIEDADNDRQSGRDSPPLPDFGQNERSPFEPAQGSRPASPDPISNAEDDGSIDSKNSNEKRPDENLLHQMARSAGQRAVRADSDGRPLPLRQLCNCTAGFLRKLPASLLSEPNRDGKLPRQLLAERGPEDFAEGARARAALLAVFDQFGVNWHTLGGTMPKGR